MSSPWFRSTFLRVLKFLEIKVRGPNFWKEPILQNIWDIWSSLLYLNLKSSMDQNPSSFITFQCILHKSRVLFSQSWNFYKLKTGNLISWGPNFAEYLNHLVLPSVFQFYKFSRPKFFVIYYIWMYSSWFRSAFVRVLIFPQIKDEGPNFLGQAVLQSVWIIWSLLLYFNFKSFLDRNYLSFIRFPCILHDWGVHISGSSNL